MVAFIHHSKKRLLLAFGLFAVVMFISSSKNQTSLLHRFLQVLPPIYEQHGGIQHFLDVALGSDPTTDKVTTHSYHVMYGIFLLPFYKKNKNMKMLEIGLGCNMRYGPGASVLVWRALFRHAQIWEAEYDGDCVEKNADKLRNIRTLVGDQGDPEVLDRWIKESGGNFDVIIDDGGHQNCQIWTSFTKLWPHLNSGGLYFIEDMQVAKSKKYSQYENEKCSKDTNVPDKLKEVLDGLMYNKRNEVMFLFCQKEACVLGKK